MGGFKVKKPWGHYVVLFESPTQRMHMVYIKKGKSTGLHTHKYRNEKWFVMKGSGLFYFNGVENEITEGAQISIKAGDVHRIIGKTKMEILAVQYGYECVDEDIEVIEDRK